MVRMRFRDINTPLTEEEQRELDAAEKMPIVFDEDCPELTIEQLRQFKRMDSAEYTKQTVSLRLSPATLKIAKSYGKGYTTFLSKLLDAAINDEDLVRKCI